MITILALWMSLGQKWRQTRGQWEFYLTFLKKNYLMIFFLQFLMNFFHFLVRRNYWVTHWKTRFLWSTWSSKWCLVNCFACPIRISSSWLTDPSWSSCANCSPVPCLRSWHKRQNCSTSGWKRWTSLVLIDLSLGSPTIWVTFNSGGLGRTGKIRSDWIRNILNPSSSKKYC